ncbi:hypothetical protein ASC58_10030 [Phycicoccus sp. Root101]|nr:hypothetical protein ASC58_10030 [Phycicoccus sp. Root101]
MAYAVSSMEWTILGDLHRLADQLPAELTLEELEPKMTSGIAGAVREAATAADHGSIKDYLTEVYQALYVAAEIRSDVLHARPATHPDQSQRLNRAETRNSRTTGQRFWIDDEWFDSAISRLNEKLSAVERVRPPFD